MVVSIRFRRFKLDPNVIEWQWRLCSMMLMAALLCLFIHDSFAACTPGVSAPIATNVPGLTPSASSYCCRRAINDPSYGCGVVETCAVCVVNYAPLSGGRNCKQLDTGVIFDSQTLAVTPILCPAGYALSGDGTSCQAIGTTDGATGACIDPGQSNQHGAPPCELSSGNPINVGTGGKYQLEEIYQGGDSNALAYSLSFNNQPLADTYKGVQYGHGRYWNNNFERRLQLAYPTGTNTGYPASVLATRADGKVITFQLKGSSYLPDASVTDILKFAGIGTSITGWQLITGNGEAVENYDASGKLLSLADRNGQIRTLTYNGQGRLASVTDVFGHQIAFGYDNQNRISTLTQPDAGGTQFSYDAHSNLSSITWPDGKIRTYLYEDINFPNFLPD